MDVSGCCRRADRFTGLSLTVCVVHTKAPGPRQQGECKTPASVLVQASDSFSCGISIVKFGSSALPPCHHHGHHQSIQPLPRALISTVKDLEVTSSHYTNKFPFSSSPVLLVRCGSASALQYAAPVISHQQCSTSTLKSYALKKTIRSTPNTNVWPQATLPAHGLVICYCGGVFMLARLHCGSNSSCR